MTAGAILLILSIVAPRAVLETLCGTTLRVVNCDAEHRTILGSLALTDDESVRAGQRALGPWVGGYPWYDRQTDDVCRIDVSEPWYAKIDPPHLNLSFSSWLLTHFDWFAWGAMAALFALLFYVLWWRRSRKRPSREAGSAKRGEDGEAAEQRRTEALPAPVARKRTDLLAEARRHYLEGRYEEAIIYLFSHELVELDKHRLIRMVKGKTNREYLRELGSRLSLRSLLEQTMVAFEDVFFGDYSLDCARFESCWSRLGEFNALAAEGTV